MRKQSSDYRKFVYVFVGLLCIAIVSDLFGESVLEDGAIGRAEMGEKEKKVELQLEIEGVLKDYAYTIEVPATSPTEEEAEEYFKKAIEEIDKDFEEIGKSIPIQKSYLDDVVKADWSFLPFGLIDAEGNIRTEKFDEETIIQAKVELSCGNYERIYEFSFLLKEPEMSEEERLLEAIERQLEKNSLEEGSSKLRLPEEVEGKRISWKEKKSYLTPKILLLEAASLLLFLLIIKRHKEEEQKLRCMKMELVYPDIVSQLSLLIGAGMTTRQAWSRLARLYVWKKEKKLTKEDIVYERILQMSRKIEEGESERFVYQQFAEEIPVDSFRRLMRMLSGSVEKGTDGMEIRLQEECRRAFEQRIVHAKKLGEEASTKMLAPLMFMMLLIMAIVMLPALLQFQL